MMSEHRAGGRDALGGQGGHQLSDTRPEDIPHLLPRNREMNDGGWPSGDLDNLRCIKHHMRSFCRVDVVLAVT